MALQIVQTADVTVAKGFDHVPVIAADLLSVNAGIPRFYALSTAEALESAAREQIQLGVQDGLDGNVAYLCWFALDAAAALRCAAGATA